MALLVVAGCQSPKQEVPDSPFLNVSQDAEVTYVGDETCATCHEELYESYQSHGMAQSFYRLTSENAVEDFSGVVLHHEASGFSYRAYRDGDRFVQEEFRLGPNGEKEHVLVRTMDYVVGSGSAARTYLTEENDRLYELPLTWYTQKEAWGFSPGYEELNSRFDRAVPARCMACHNGYSEPVEDVPGKFVSLADGIGCESCHGPGSLHVEERTAVPEPVDSIDYTIVNPAHLELDLRLDVCQQCHLHTDVSILREGQTAFGYRPSTPLSSHRALFSPLEGGGPARRAGAGGVSPDGSSGEAAGEGIAVISHADRMKQSQCFIQSRSMSTSTEPALSAAEGLSAGEVEPGSVSEVEPMDCLTCHDPHEGFREQGPEYFNVTCRECHDTGALQESMPTPELRADHAVGANCFSCHMPKVQAEDAPHASFTDHFIRVVKENPSIEKEEPPHPERSRREGGTEGVLQPYFPRDESGPEAEVMRGMAYVVYGRGAGGQEAMQEGVNTLRTALEERPDTGEGQFLLGFALLQMGQPRSAIEPLQKAVDIAANPERLNALAQAMEQSGGNAAAIEQHYRRALELQPAAANVRVNYGRFLETQGRLDEAIAQYRAAIEEEPWNALAQYNLGTALLRTGVGATGRSPLQDAMSHLDEAIRLDPDNADALTNLGAVYAQSGDLTRAGRLFERAVTADSANANALGNLALFRLQQGNSDEARRFAESALSRDPNQGAALQVMQALGIE